MRLADFGTDPDPACPDDGHMEGQKILVIDLFAGIGGLSIALEKAGIRPHHVVAVESNPHYRILRRKFPGTEFCGGGCA